MFALPLTLLFTAVFTVTGVVSFVRLISEYAARSGGSRRLVELAHLLMSLAMIGMCWGVGVGQVGLVVQVIVFAALAAAMLVQLVRTGPQLDLVAHVIATGAMIWMAAAMPALMGHSTSGGSGAHHHGGGDHVAAAGPAVAVPAPTWAVAGTVLVAVLLLPTCVHWARRFGTSAAQLWGRTCLACHLLMGLGMAGALAAML